MIRRKGALVVVFVTLMHVVYAQIPKGTIMAGGSLGFQFSTDRSINGSSLIFDISPQIGRFVAPNFVLGISPIVRYGQQSGSSNGMDYFHSQFTLGLGPLVRYYVKIGPKVYFFAQAIPVSVAAEWDHDSGDPTQPYYKNLSVIWSAGPGLSVMLAKGIALELGLNYSGVWHNTSIFQNGNLLSEGKSYVDHGMVFNVGIQVYIERNKKEKELPK
jgi:hypothetical protein